MADRSSHEGSLVPTQAEVRALVYAAGIVDFHRWAEHWEVLSRAHAGAGNTENCVVAAEQARYFRSCAEIAVRQARADGRHGG